MECALLIVIIHYLLFMHDLSTSVCFVLDLGVGGVRGTDLLRALNPRDPSFSGGRLLTGVASGGFWSR